MSRQHSDDIRFHNGFCFRPLGSEGLGGVLEFQCDDLVIADNRNRLHCATWYDAAHYTRLMWRTTVMGNPGDEYADEEQSWIPRDGSDVMAGMKNA
jgi:hypothetical protein